MKFGEFEEVVFFGDGFEEAAAVGAGGSGGGVDEGFVGDTVGAGVGREIDLVFCYEFAPELLDAGYMKDPVVRMNLS